MSSLLQTMCPLSRWLLCSLILNINVLIYSQRPDQIFLIRIPSRAGRVRIKELVVEDTEALNSAPRLLTEARPPPNGPFQQQTQPSEINSGRFIQFPSGLRQPTTSISEFSSTASQFSNEFDPVRSRLPSRIDQDSFASALRRIPSPLPTPPPSRRPFEAPQPMQPSWVSQNNQFFTRFPASESQQFLSPLPRTDFETFASPNQFNSRADGFGGIPESAAVFSPLPTSTSRDPLTLERLATGFRNVLSKWIRTYSKNGSRVARSTERSDSSRPTETSSTEKAPSTEEMVTIPELLREQESFPTHRVKQLAPTESEERLAGPGTYTLVFSVSEGDSPTTPTSVIAIEPKTSNSQPTPTSHYKSTTESVQSSEDSVTEPVLDSELRAQRPPVPPTESSGSEEVPSRPGTYTLVFKLPEADTVTEAPEPSKRPAVLTGNFSYPSETSHRETTITPPAKKTPALFTGSSFYTATPETTKSFDVLTKKFTSNLSVSSNEATRPPFLKTKSNLPARSSSYSVTPETTKFPELLTGKFSYTAEPPSTETTKPPLPEPTLHSFSSHSLAAESKKNPKVLTGKFSYTSQPSSTKATTSPQPRTRPQSSSYSSNSKPTRIPEGLTGKFSYNSTEATETPLPKTTPQFSPNSFSPEHKKNPEVLNESFFYTSQPPSTEAATPPHPKTAPHSYFYPLAPEPTRTPEVLTGKFSYTSQGFSTGATETSLLETTPSSSSSYSLSPGPRRNPELSTAKFSHTSQLLSIETSTPTLPDTTPYSSSYSLAPEPEKFPEVLTGQFSYTSQPPFIEATTPALLKPSNSSSHPVNSSPSKTADFFTGQTSYTTEPSREATTTASAAIFLGPTEDSPSIFFSPTFFSQSPEPLRVPEFLVGTSSYPLRHRTTPMPPKTTLPYFAGSSSFSLSSQPTRTPDILTGTSHYPLEPLLLEMTSPSPPREPSYFTGSASYSLNSELPKAPEILTGTSHYPLESSFLETTTALPPRAPAYFTGSSSYSLTTPIPEPFRGSSSYSLNPPIPLTTPAPQFFIGSSSFPIFSTEVPVIPIHSSYVSSQPFYARPGFGGYQRPGLGAYSATPPSYPTTPSFMYTSSSYATPPHFPPASSYSTPSYTTPYPFYPAPSFVPRVFPFSSFRPPSPSPWPATHQPYPGYTSSPPPIPPQPYSLPIPYNQHVPQVVVSSILYPGAVINPPPAPFASLHPVLYEQLRRRVQDRGIRRVVEDTPLGRELLRNNPVLDEERVGRRWKVSSLILVNINILFYLGCSNHSFISSL